MEIQNACVVLVFHASTTGGLSANDAMAARDIGDAAKIEKSVGIQIVRAN